MSGNRGRKARIRTRQRETGESYVQAACQVKGRRSPIGTLLERAAADLCVVDPADTDAVLRVAWTGVCTVGAAGELLSICAGPRHYRACWMLARPSLADAVTAMRAAPTLRGASVEVNPAGGPGERLDDRVASQVDRLLAETADVAGAALSRAAVSAQARAARRACRAGAAAGVRIAEIYRAPRAEQPNLALAAEHPEWLQASTRDDLQHIIDSHLAQLQQADPADAPAVLTVTWYGFAVAGMLGQFMARRDPDCAVLNRNALPVIERVTQILQAAPSMPAGIHGAGLDTSLAGDPAVLGTARRGIRDLTLAINEILPQAAELASHAADRMAARMCTALAGELDDCYAGHRLRSYLNPLGRDLGARSQVIRGAGQPGRSRRRAREQ